MLRYNLLVLAVGGMTMAAIASRDHAQSGQALAFAEHACLEYGAPPGTQIFERCIVGAAKAFDRGEPDIAYAEARVARASRESCSGCADGLSKP